MEVIITEHAYDRFFERLNFSEDKANEYAKNAMLYGADEGILDEAVRNRYQLKMDDEHFLKIYKNHIYVFEEKKGFTYVLITIYPLQEKFRRRKKKR